jgi:hypothetical protein
MKTPFHPITLVARLCLQQGGLTIYVLENILEVMSSAKSVLSKLPLASAITASVLTAAPRAVGSAGGRICSKVILPSVPRAGLLYKGIDRKSLPMNERTSLDPAVSVLSLEEMKVSYRRHSERVTPNEG